MWDFHKYVEVRDAIVTYLTLFNARRGGEPGRLTLSQWYDVMKGT